MTKNEKTTDLTNSKEVDSNQTVTQNSPKVPVIISSEKDQSETKTKKKSVISEANTSRELMGGVDVKITSVDDENILECLENANQTPRQLKALLDTLDTKIELIEDILSKQSKQAQRVPGIDKRIKTLDLYDEQIDTSDRYLSDLNKIRLKTELTNLNEKRFQVWQKFVRGCGSEKKALKYQNLRAKAKSSYYHSKSSYFVKQRILKILNDILNDDKSGLEEVKNLADNSSEDSIKLFNEKMRDLLDVYDEDLVILCSHYQREFYFNIMRLTLVKWNPETDLNITELVVPIE